ncbi:MAG: phospholipase [Chitinophagaceae bacterium]|nr:MAG: phospholipase [Chitinophagaceae bacterium]
MQKKKVYLVLSSGGARGMAHIGVIEEIEKLGWEIVAVSGSSMGAAVGGVYAAGKLEAFKSWMYTLDKIDVYRLMDFTINSKGFIKGERVFKQMENIIGGSPNIENLPVKFSAAATDLNKRKCHFFKSGNLLDAIRASVAVPTVLTPFVKNNNTYIDGGIANPIPVNAFLKLKYDLKIIVNVNANREYTVPEICLKKPVNETNYRFQIDKFIDYWWNGSKNMIEKKEELGYFKLLTKSIEIMMDHISDHILEKNKPDLIIEVSRDAASIMDFYKSEEMVEAGREAFLKEIHALEHLSKATEEITNLKKDRLL